MKYNFYHIVSYLAGLSSVSAAPTIMTARQAPPWPSKSQVDNYDDLPNALVATPITNYQEVTYGNWSYGSAQAVQVGGVASHSYPSRIASTPTGTQTFSPQSPNQALALFDFYYGCALRASTAAVTQATTCTITLTGYSASTGKAVVTASFKFTPPLSPITPVPMVQAILPSGFNQKLSKVEFKVSNPLTTVGLVDNLGYGLFLS
ncbi:MAG: hypothetical protein Q9208_003990 [Pyrenodesmia sp. 3 TL-2023]